MYIMPSCFSDRSKTAKDPAKDSSPTVRSVESFVVDNPLMFRLCCCCVVRRRKRVGTAKQNGANGHISDNHSDESVLKIEHIEFSQTSPPAS